MKFKNMSTLIACGALVAAIGAVSVSASSPFTTLQVKVEDGVKHYSTDDGRTWSTDAPEGVTETTDESGKVTITRGNAPADGEADGRKFYTSQHGVDEGEQESVIDGEAGQAGLLIKVEDGVKLYSTDGGKTWSEPGPVRQPNERSAARMRRIAPHCGSLVVARRSYFDHLREQPAR